MRTKEELEADRNTTVLLQAMEEALASVPFPFRNCEVMSAAMHIIVDAGMSSGVPKEKLIEDICCAARSAVMSWVPSEVVEAGGLQ